MNTNSGFEDHRDSEIARYFLLMRQRDAAQSPSFPDAEELSMRAPLDTRRGHSAVVLQVAAAGIVALVVGLLMMNASPEDPGVLYADIMNSNAITTDHLMQVSPGTSPEMISTMSVFEHGVSTGLIQEIN